MFGHALTPVVQGLSLLYIFTMMLTLGLELGGGPKESKDEKRHKRHALALGLAFNLALLPLVAFVVTRALHPSNAVSVALLLLAAAPGGRYAPHLVKLGRGDVALSVEVTVYLAKITCITAVPLSKWMLTLHTLEIHELPFLVQLVLLQLLPFYFGKWLKKTRPAQADRLVRPTHAVAIGSLLVLVAVVVLQTEKWIEIFDARSWLAVACVGVLSPLLGWVLGGRNAGHRRAFALGADAREFGLALMMATFAFPAANVHAALLGVGTILGLASFLLALATRTIAPRHGTRRRFAPTSGAKAARAHA
jgi:BASS family bile acid:Na+ symporter